MKLTAPIIIKTVADYFNRSTDEVTSDDRHGDFVIARHISMYYIKDKCKLSLAKTGEFFEGKNGCKDHATVLHAIKSVNDQVETDRYFRRVFNEIKVLLDSGKMKEVGRFSITINFRFYYFRKPRMFAKVCKKYYFKHRFAIPVFQINHSIEKRPVRNPVYAGIISYNNQGQHGYVPHCL